MRTAFSSAVPNHRRPGPVTRRNEVDRFSRSDSGGTVGYFVSPRLFSSQEESSRFYFPFFGGGENRRWLCRGFAIHQSDFIGQEYAVTRLLAIIRFSPASPHLQYFRKISKYRSPKETSVTSSSGSTSGSESQLPSASTRFMVR